MSEVAWFTLLLRAVGLLIIAQMSPGFVASLAYVVTAWDEPFNTSPMLRIPMIATVLGYGLAIGFGMYLLFGGRRVVRLCVRDLIARCAVCGYPLVKITGPVCPECGVPVRSESASVNESRTEKESG
jgi:hypothetical protein